MTNEIFNSEEKQETITAYTDGSTYPSNPGQGGYCVLLMYKKGIKLYTKTIQESFEGLTKCSGKELDLLKQGKKRKPIERNGMFFVETTNNRMELSAVITAMKSVKQPDKFKLIVYSDSQWAINVTNGSWKAKENLDLVHVAQTHYKKYKDNIELKWVRGHDGNEYNEYCDEMALDAAQGRYKEKRISCGSEDIV